MKRLFHVVHGDNRIPPGTRGIVLRKFGKRDFEILLIVPLPGRRNMLCDYANAIVLDARREGYAGLQLQPSYFWPRLFWGSQEDATQARVDVTKEILRIYRAVP